MKQTNDLRPQDIEILNKYGVEFDWVSEWEKFDECLVGNYNGEPVVHDCIYQNMVRITIKTLNKDRPHKFYECMAGKKGYTPISY